MKRSQLAINTVSLRGEFAEILDGVAEAGFAQIEFHLAQVKSFLTNRTLEDLKGSLRESGLTCIGGFEGGIDASATPEAAANNALLVENARLLSELGGGVTQSLIVGTNMPLGADCVKHYAQVVGEVAGQMAPLGVNLLLEFNWGAVKTLPLAAEIVRQSGAANAGVLFDPAHFYCTPTKMEDLTPENVATIKHVHVNNMRRKAAELSNCNSDRLLPDDPDGVLDLKSIFGLLETHGYRGIYSMEMFSDELWALPPQQAAQQMFESLLSLCD